MSHDRMQRQRFELKYLLEPEQALAVRELVAAHLVLDENGAGQPGLSYPVHSLYLDSPDLAIFWSTINGDKNRYKLRVRFYNDLPDSPVFLEIKRRVNGCILKQRGGVHKHAIARLLEGHLPAPGDLLKADARSVQAVHRFIELATRIQAVPQAHVYYQREAYVDPVHDNVRVTMDRDVLTQPRSEVSFKTEMVSPSRPFGDRVILELKFTDRFPDWLRLMVERFGLTQCGAAKYCEGVAGLPQFHVGHAGDFRASPEDGKGAIIDPRVLAASYA
jgi:hypothetical protein